MKINISQREVFLITAAGILLVLFVFFQFVFLPKSGEINSNRAKLKKAAQELKIAEGKLAILKNLEQAPLVGTRLKKTKETQTIEALKHISSIISRLNLELLSIRPRREEKAIGSAKAILFDIDFIGSYNNIHKFMQALEKLPILVLVDSIDLRRAERGEVAVTIILSVYY